MLDDLYIHANDDDNNDDNDNDNDDDDYDDNDDDDNDDDDDDDTMNSIHSFWTSGDIGTSSAEPT